jgi:N-methylhydantoinase B
VEASSAILAQSEEAVRQTIAQVADGTYAFEDYVDDDGITDSPIRIAVEITVRKGEMIVDLSGCSAQVAGPVNCTLNIAKSAIYYAVITGLGGEFQANSGCYAPIKIVAPEGTVVNALPPAPVVSRINVGHRVVNVILGALAQAKPGSIPAAYYGVSYFYALQTVSASAARTIYVDSIVGGWGAEPNRDGASTFSCGLHNLASIPIEMIERHHPITFTRYSMRPDSGGAGRQRGGLGMIREWRLEAAQGALSVSFDRFRYAPFGVDGGGSGATGRLSLTRDGKREELRSKMIGMRLHKGDVVTIETSGGGGFGPPAERSRTAIAADIRAGYVTDDSAKRDYGYAPDLPRHGS